MRRYDPDEEEVIRDKFGRLARVYHDGELVYHRHYECANCGMKTEIDGHPDLKLCPDCGRGRGKTGITKRIWYDGPWADARLDDIGEFTG